MRVLGHFIFYEVFPTKEDFEAHNNMPYVKEWFSKLPQFAEGDVKTRMEVHTASREWKGFDNDLRRNKFRIENC